MFILNTNKNFFAIIINIKIGEKIMKKLAILGSAKSCVLEDILKYFNGKDVEITCLSDDEHCEFFKKAKELNITVLSLNGKYNGLCFSNDLAHPNELGYLKFANILKSIIK